MKLTYCSPQLKSYIRICLPYGFSYRPYCLEDCASVLCERVSEGLRQRDVDEKGREGRGEGTGSFRISLVLIEYQLSGLVGSRPLLAAQPSKNWRSRFESIHIPNISLLSSLFRSFSIQFNFISVSLSGSLFGNLPIKCKWGKAACNAFLKLYLYNFTITRPS